MNYLYNNTPNNKDASIYFYLSPDAFIRSHIALGRNWLPILKIRKGHTLVTDYPYRFIRHPIIQCR
ncbi:isoprenylcysteine carboxylmethyltransferase family protein [Methanosarcina lacustris]|uniref:isoprenylcysteine carboxylmethyltransferase family protein n=1 Tax=Methanosarcina lacustris TaxID=170861 RepID=UPI0009FEEB79